MNDDPNLTADRDRSASSVARVDFAAVKAAHRPSTWHPTGQGWCERCGMSEGPEACLIYRLAVEVERLAGKVAEAWDEGYLDARHAARYPHVEAARRPTNPYRIALADQPEQVQP